jgi:alkylation response protein AidB-like acyl-CoA dehydrogenase
MITIDNLGPEDRAFQEEVRAFFAENLTPALREAGRKTTWAISEFDYGRQWQKILHARGWGAPNWPVEFGGTDWTVNQRLIWAVENARERPPLISNMGRDLCAPCIMAFGTPEQKSFYLPRILSGEDWWAQGYSEPGAGSDLAALQMRADRNGDEYVLNGSKIWTTMAHHSNRIFCLVRTSREERKQMGISFLLVDMDTPGIEIRPIVNLAGQHEFNQVFFTDARVPRSALLGEEGKGWTVARHLLAREHSGSVFDGLEMRRRLTLLEAIATSEPNGRGGVIMDDPLFMARFAEVAVECETSDAVTRRLVKAVQADEMLPHLSELINIRRRQLGQKLSFMLVEALGNYAAPFQTDALHVGGKGVAGPAHAEIPTAFYLAQRAGTIAGGTTEIHYNNVARHVLGL